MMIEYVTFYETENMMYIYMGKADAWLDSVKQTSSALPVHFYNKVKY